MTAAASLDFEAPVEMTASLPVKPFWLRPAAFGFALAVHASVFALFAWPHDPPATPLDAIEVSIVPLGVPEPEAQAAPAVQPTPDDKPDLIETDPTPVAPPPEPVVETPLLAIEAPIKEVEEAIAVPLLEKPPELPKPVEQPKPPVVQTPRPVKKVEKRQPTQEQIFEELQKKKRAAERQRARAAEKQASIARAGAETAQRRGVENGQESNSGMSRAAYGSLILSEVQRHKFYPPSARSEGATGSVGVTFTVGSTGNIVSHSITHSSGSAALDGAVHQMMHSVHAPPPPGGSFVGSTTIRFNFAQ